VHSVVTAAQNSEFAKALNRADMATPDGAPVAWMLRRLGSKGQQRINGPDLMWRFCDASQSSDSCERGNGKKAEAPAIFLYGSTDGTLTMLKAKLLTAFPALKIAGMYSPPFRALTEAEDAAVVDAINASGARVVFVSLGCPKQELWMEAHRGRIQAVMIGVGAAFDYHAGTIKRAPRWMQDCGLEWLHRLASEPRRLWKRYLVTNTLFVLGATKQLILGVGRQEK
jgi:N-acetylglucosaminyldiphosphoundecaprenol N-acetyl-beta-D-mannosaminyltransferase